MNDFLALSESWIKSGYARPVILPGIHDGCRCYIQPFKMPDGARVIVWYTANDQYVCTDPIQTPFGTVSGCRDLHLRVISEGLHLGEIVTR